VPDTAAALRLPALEMTDTMEEVGSLSTELTDGIRSSARAVSSASHLTTNGISYLSETVVNDVVPMATKVGKRLGRRAHGAWPLPLPLPPSLSLSASLLHSTSFPRPGPCHDNLNVNVKQQGIRVHDVSNPSPEKSGVHVHRVGIDEQLTLVLFGAMNQKPITQLVV
jgi:hypothetical protein